eukprot:COSAG04_NODE_23009_length_345_cov_1.052846_1_plen_82_part_01
MLRPFHAPLQPESRMPRRRPGPSPRDGAKATPASARGKQPAAAKEAAPRTPDVEPRELEFSSPGGAVDVSVEASAPAQAPAP